jgi:hypothetical protein
MSVSASVTIWIQEDSTLPTGYLNPHGKDEPFPLIQLDGAVLQGLKGDPVPYLRKLAEVASRLADELEAVRPAAVEAVAP